jgi:hypothetical protein
MEGLASVLAPVQPYGIYLIASGGLLIALGLIIGFFEKPAPVAMPAQTMAPSRQNDEDPVARLEKLADLRKRGLITEADYEALKAKALQRD